MHMMTVITQVTVKSGREPEWDAAKRSSAAQSAA
jgi:hypothetical protein